jgi:hypothetical protein
MNAYRLMATSAMTCAAGLSLAACSVGISTASPSPSPAASRTASSSPVSHSASASGSPADTVPEDAPIGPFPVPHGAQLVANMGCGKQILIELSSVTPAQASTFYTSALSRAGYNITENTLTSDPSTGAPQGMAEITFTGRGYTGLIIAIADLGAEASADPSMAGLPSNFTKNSLEISLTPTGTASTSACPS